MIGKSLGHHEILEKIGAGGMGEIYRARDTRLGRQVAIKLLPDSALQDREARERFLREARAASALSHPNICTIHDIGEHEGRHYIVMELLEGQTLQEKLREGPLATDEILELGRQMAEGLDAAHTTGILHRDIKPGNLFITTRGLVKILDFGLAKPTGPRSGAGSDVDARTVALDQFDLLLTSPGMAVGTIAYMSPEQSLGQAIDVRTDLFSLGAVLYEMATGKQAFTGPTPAAVFDAILHHPPSPVADVNADISPELIRIIDTALSKKRDDRYESADALLADLEGLRLQGAPTGSRVVPATDTGTREMPSIAVLPFINMSADPENEFFTDGMSEEIITTLNKIESLQVASRTSSFAFKGKQEDIREIGRTLSVSTVLEGSVRKAGDRLRITAQLVKVDDGYHLWSERFDRDFEDVFAVQDEIAESIAGALRVVLSASEKHAIQKIPTHNMDAYELYVRGLARLHRIRDENLTQAASLFRQAVTLDPDFALGWVGVAMNAAWLHDWFERTEEHRETADDASRRALALDPELPEAHVARGLAASMRKDYVTAAHAFEEAARLNPRLFDAYYYHGRTRLSQGDLESASHLLARASEVRPEDYQAASILSTCYRGLGRPEEERAAARRSVEAAEKHLQLYPDDVRAVYMSAGNRAVLGERDQALKLIRRALKMAGTDSGVRYNVACTYARMGMADEALDLLEQNIVGGWGNPEWISHDPDFDGLREHPRFVALMEKLAEYEAE